MNRIGRSMVGLAVVAAALAAGRGADAQPPGPRQPVSPGQGTYRADAIGIEYRLVPYRGHYAAELTAAPDAGSPATKLWHPGERRYYVLMARDQIVALDSQLIDGPADVDNHVGLTTIDARDGTTGQITRFTMTLPGGQGGNVPPPNPYPNPYPNPNPNPPGPIGGSTAPESRRVRPLLIVDTDSKLAGLDEDWESMEAVLAPLRTAGRCDSPTVLSGRAVTRDNVLRWLRSQADTAPDTLVVYYTGHGATDPNPARGHFLAFTNGPPLFRSEIVLELRRLRPRLAVLLTDCCSNLVNAAAAPAAPMPGDQVARSLFLRTRGYVSINAATTGESAWCDMTGGFFTTALRDTVLFGRLEDLDANRDGLLTWAEVFPTLVRSTGQKYRMFRTNVLQYPANNDPRTVAALQRQADQRPQAFALDGR